CIPFEEKPQILFQTWETFFAIQCSQPEDSNELFQKLLKDLKELVEYDQSTRTDRPIFLNDNEDHHVQNRESPENSSEENVVSKTNQEPPQNSDIHQLIDECYEEVPEEQKQNMEKTMLDLVKICHHKQFLCIHDDVEDLIESALDSKRLSINSINTQQLDKKEKEVKIVEEQQAEHGNRKDKEECTVPISKNFPDCDNHSDTFSDSKIDDDISVYDNDFEDIEYVEASLLDPEIVSIEEENGVEEENVDLKDISQVQDVVLREKLFSITRLISNIESLNDNSTPDCVFDSFESDNSLLDNFSPEFETFCDHLEETRSGNTTHADNSFPEYDSFCFEIEPDQERLINLMKNDIPDNSSNDPLLEEVDLFLFDDSIPPGIENVVDDPEGDIQPPDDNFDLEPEVISAVMEDIDDPDEHFNPGGEIFVSTNNEDVDYFPFMFVIRIFFPYLILPEISPLFLFADSEDTIFDP
nr:hypothetical protein [Tanacetum cinerariifolium]